jgi:hypothetical protein
MNGEYWLWFFIASSVASQALHRSELLATFSTAKMEHWSDRPGLTIIRPAAFYRKGAEKKFLIATDFPLHIRPFAQCY